MGGLDFVTKVDTSLEHISESWEEAIFLAHLEHDLLVGTKIVVPWLFHCEGDDVHGEFTVQLLPARKQDIEHRVDDYLDPYWDVKPVCADSKRLFEEAEASHKWMWVGGPAYKIIKPKGNEK